MDFYTRGQHRALEKLGVVRAPVKQYRRLRAMLAPGESFFHATGHKGVEGVLETGAIRPGAHNHYGVGAYFNKGHPSTHGPMAFGVAPERAQELGMQMVKDQARDAWALVPGRAGAQLGRKDALIIREDMPRLRPLIDQARQRGLRVFNPEITNRAYMELGMPPAKADAIAEKMRTRGY